MKLLFVDDSPTVCAIYSALLREAGYEVFVANGMVQALELAEQHLPEIAIIDFYMPDGNGDELTRALQSTPATANIIVAIHSQFPDVVEKALAAGAVEMIGKDDPHNLFLMRVAALRRLVEGISFRRQLVGSVRQQLDRQQDRALQILLVDDSPTIRAVYNSLLSEQGYEVREADSIATAEVVAAEYLPQLMIIDYMLPDGNGDELIRRLLTNPETSDILMVMFSQRQDVEAQAIGAGAIDLLYKDDPTEIFLRRIASLQRYIRAQQMQRRIEQEVMAQENEMQMRIHDLERIKREKRFVERLIESIPIGLLVVGGGRVITSNAWFEHLFGVEAEENHSFSSLWSQLQLPAGEDGGCSRYGAGKELFTAGKKLLRVHCFGVDLEHDDPAEEGNVVMWMFEDITQLRRAEEQEQFAAFQSGLVEMSATILHNIGNALTGINGAVWRAEEGVQQLEKVEQAMLKADSLLKAWASEQATVDERLQRIGKILDVGVNQVYREVMEDLDRNALQPIQLGVRHISEIIQVQQSAARPGAQAVPCELDKVVEDVLVMQQTVLDRSAIEVKCQFDAELVAYQLPRNQLLQAINNLVKNSYEAIVEQERNRGVKGGGEIVINIERYPAQQRVALTVADNGVGLASSELEKVMQFGYTTKEKGSGFGLHATANFIKSIGGEISIASEGGGLGSRVEMMIPMGVVEKNNE